MGKQLQVDEYFDKLYRDHDRYWWQGENRYATDASSYPYSLLTQQTLRLLNGGPPGRALDLGAGEGSDAIRLAILKYEVDAIEISKVAAEKIMAFADHAGVGSRVRVAVADAQSFIPDGRYDVVICNGLLHYVEDKVRVINRMQQATNVGGLNVIALWSNYTDVPKRHNSIPVFCDDEHGIVTSLYGNWSKELLYFERDKMESSHSDLPAHRHSHIKLIARRGLD